MADLNYFFIAAAGLFIACAFMSKVSTRYGIPALLVFLGVGMLAGSDGIGKIHFDDAALAQAIGITSLILILFSGGLDTNWNSIRPFIKQGTLLSTFGVIFTCGLVSLFAHFWLTFSWIESILLGAIVSSTDAAAVFSILRAKGLGFRDGIRETLEIESGSNDPMAVFLTVTCLQFLAGAQLNGLEVFFLFCRQMLVGLLIGVMAGQWIRHFINKIRLEHEGLYPVLTISSVFLVFGLSEVIGGNGFLSVYVTAIVLGRATFIHKKSLIIFHDSLAWLMQILMFLCLGLLVLPSRLPEIMVPGILLAFFLLFIARPISVFISLIGTNFTFREKLLISWLGLRGAVPVILATYALTSGVEKSELIFNMVFFVVLISTMMQGVSVKWVAKLLGVYQPLTKKFRFSIGYTVAGELKNELTEVEVPSNSKVVGKSIAELNPPSGVLILLIQRGKDVFSPRGGTILAPSDVLLVLANEQDIKVLIKVVNEGTLFSDINSNIDLISG